MKKAFWFLVLMLVIFALAACNLFFDPKVVAYSVTHNGGTPAAIDVAGADEDGVIFTSSTTTDWGYSFELKYTDFPFEAFLAVTNKSGTESVTMAVYREGSLIASNTVTPGATAMISPSVGY
jgi:hypothetical protein